MSAVQEMKYVVLCECILGVFDLVQEGLPEKVEVVKHRN